LKSLVVGSNVVELEEDDGFRRRTIRPRVAFIHPDGPLSGPSSEMEMADEGDNAAAAVQQSQLPTGSSGEKITALLDWQFSHGEKQYHMIVVGTMLPRVEKSESAGRLIYITARPNPAEPGQIESAIKNAHTYKFPVRAIAAMEPSSLAVAVGDEIILQKLDPQTRRWRKLPPYKMESSPVTVTVRGELIYVLTSRHSLCILKADDSRLSLIGQGGFDREGLDHVHLGDDSQLVMTSNRGGAIVGLSTIGLTLEQKLLRPVFAAHMPLSVVRLSRSFKRKATGTSQYAYGTTIDGTVYRFTTLSEEEWRLLRFIQNLCLADRKICPFTKRRRTTTSEIDPYTLSKPEAMHVNGDILSRLARRGAPYLEYLVTGEMPVRSGTANDTGPSHMAGQSVVDSEGNSPRLVQIRKFHEFAESVVGNADDVFEGVMMFMEDFLRVGL
jgi:hypothetical protein